mmetsp:Transcript_20346/g.22105  ORF Transcript_20346/g.22105 Transcript_20346/m.22105 type:complete len:316 (+) Transcript_20346:253-1200(+)
MNRLDELKRNAPPLDDITVEVDSDRGLVNNGGGGKGGKGNEQLNEFFNDVEIVKRNIAIIKEATRKISEINQNVVQATTADKESDYSSELESVISETNKKAAGTKQLLQKLQEDTKRMRTSNTSANSKAQADIRLRENMFNTLTRKFVDVMKEYQNAQTKYKTDIKKKVKRQVQIVKPDATTEEIDAVFKAGGGAGDVFKSAILTGEAADAIRNAYQNAQDKYRDVLILESSVAELHQMFVDFATLTERQGELLDQIEHQVKDAADYIDQGNTELVEAIEIQKSIRKKQCCIALIVLIIIGIIVGLVAAKVQGGL